MELRYAGGNEHCEPGSRGVGELEILRSFLPPEWPSRRVVSGRCGGSLHLRSGNGAARVAPASGHGLFLCGDGGTGFGLGLAQISAVGVFRGCALPNLGYAGWRSRCGAQRIYR